MYVKIQLHGIPAFAVDCSAVLHVALEWIGRTIGKALWSHPACWPTCMQRGSDCSGLLCRASSSNLSLPLLVVYSQLLTI